ncbi:MAG: hypothetical protein BWY74_03158 [Firmicutes bacterium ADurb.Bin419]|nr:MAG: hypothetical protein BWY74_03158 [Firmicutes bacterium ADurb.Bin419]
MVLSSGESTCSRVDHMVVSVGPYTFNRQPQRSRSCPARSFGKASPPHRILRLFDPFHPDSINSRHVAGVACIRVMLCSSNNSAIRLPSVTSSLPAITTLAPAIIGINNSSPAMSKDNVVTASSESPLVIPVFCSILLSRFNKAYCSICTPFGLPVEPEV